jgi:serine/threonine-protein kinase
VLLAFVVLVAAGGAWAAYTFFTKGPTVPAVIGRRQSDAVSVVRAEKLRPVVHKVWADGRDAGRVARQRPRAGTGVKKGVKVDLWVSRGPLHIPSPDLTGLKSPAALALLDGQSLSGHKRKAATLELPKGQIFRQSPEPGATVSRGDTVTYWVSSGPPIVAVPDVIGFSSGDAKAALKAKGFTVNQDLVAGFGVVPGDVVDQDPVGGTLLRKGDEVVIKVAVF